MEPVVILTGARTVGKSTLLAACADAHGVGVVDLDDPAVLEKVSDDPTFYVRADRPRPVCIDEFQHELRLLAAIKAQLNRGLEPGRYLLTGSTRYATLPRTSQSLTGRAHVMTMWPLSQGELIGRREAALDQLITDPRSLVYEDRPPTDRAEYTRLVLAGGYPVALNREDRDRHRWFDDYLDLVIQRDVLEIRNVRERRLLLRILRHLAAQTGQVLNIANIANAIQVDAHTTGDLVALLESVFLVHRLGAFGSSLGSRVAKSPKVHMVDTGLAAHLLGVTQAKLSGLKPAVLTEFGHLVETFAVNELMKQAGWADERVEFSHFRTRDGHGVDLVIEARDGRVAGVEMKASSMVSDKDFRGLRILRDRLGDDFVGGVVINLGEHAYTHDDRLCVLPLDRLWTE